MTVIQFPTHRIQERPRSKRETASALGRSTRFLELRMKEGLPYSRDENGHARFVLSDVTAWLEGRAS